MGTHTIVTGLALGDEGKGTIVDYLVRKANNPLVVRFNGGSQAAHNVVTPDGEHHTFAQFGSGTLAGAPTYLSEFTIVNPANLLPEAEHLARLGVHPFKMLFVASEALVVTPYHIAANRMREDARGDGRHGSTGQGIGETVESAMRFPESAIRVKDLEDLYYNLTQKLRFWRSVKMLEMQDIGVDTRGTIFDDPDDKFLTRVADGMHSVSKNITIVGPDWLQHQFDRHDVIFEGAQGVLLDERLGFHPHTTWSKTTPHNARLLLAGREAYNLGVTRAYGTRHGAGPFPTDMGSLGQEMFPEEHNGTGEYQGSFRVGAFDFLSLTYSADSLAASGHKLDGIAITHMDRIGEQVPACWLYDNYPWQKIPTFHELGYNEPCMSHQVHITEPMQNATPQFNSLAKRDFSDAVETELETPIVIESFGSTHEDKKDYR